MILIQLEKDKTLTISSEYETFKGEHLADKVKISIPDKVCDKDISSCSVYMCYINAFGQYAPIRLDDMTVDTTDDGRVFEDDITNVFTSVPGKMSIWLEIKNIITCMNMKTEPCEYTIFDHENGDEHIPEKRLDLLDKIIAKYELLLQQGGGSGGEDSGSPGTNVEGAAIKEWVAQHYAQKSTTLAGYGITNGVTLDAYNSNNASLLSRLKELSDSGKAADDAILATAKSYTDEVFASMIDASEVAM